MYFTALRAWNGTSNLSGARLPGYSQLYSISAWGDGVRGAELSGLCSSRVVAVRYTRDRRGVSLGVRRWLVGDVSWHGRCAPW